MISKYLLDTMDKFLNGERPEIMPYGVKTIYNVKYYDAQMYDADIFYREDRTQKGVILNIHGGGFLSGEKKGLREFCGLLAEMGYFIFSINYPLAPEFPHPSPIESAFKALDFMVRNSKEYSLDMSKVYITGESAGAYAALYTALIILNNELADKYQLSSPIPKDALKGLMLYCGIFDFEEAWKSHPRFIFRDMIREYTGLKKKAFITDNDKQYYSPINFVNEKLPRTLIAYAKYDPLKKQGIMLSEKLIKNSVNTSVFYARRFLSMHDFQLGLKSKDALECVEITRKFLK